VEAKVNGGDIITLGNGASDAVTAYNTTFPSFTITLGNGNGDTVDTDGGGNTISLGNGVGDQVNSTIGSRYDTIKLGDGDGGYGEP
jgi:hypothetical protein